MGASIVFPKQFEKTPPSRPPPAKDKEFDFSNVVVLPVVRIERHPDDPKPKRRKRR